VVTGLLLAAAGLALLARLSPATGYLDFLPSLVLMGAGLGGTFVAITSSAVAGVPQEDTGVASALLNASQQIGGSLGLAVLTAVATARFNTVRPLHPTPATLATATTSSWAYAFIVAAGLLVGAAIITGWLLRPTPDQPHPEELTATDEAINRQAEGVALLPSTRAIEPAGAPLSPSSAVRVMTRCGCHG
jgi:sugar phosphate permease